MRIHLKLNIAIFFLTYLKLKSAVTFTLGPYLCGLLLFA